MAARGGVSRTGGSLPPSNLSAWKMIWPLWLGTLPTFWDTWPTTVLSMLLGIPICLPTPTSALFWCGLLLRTVERRHSSDSSLTIIKVTSHPWHHIHCFHSWDVSIINWMFCVYRHYMKRNQHLVSANHYAQTCVFDALMWGANFQTRPHVMCHPYSYEYDLTKTPWKLAAHFPILVNTLSHKVHRWRKGYHTINNETTACQYILIQPIIIICFAGPNLFTLCRAVHRLHSCVICHNSYLKF